MKLSHTWLLACLAFVLGGCGSSATPNSEDNKGTFKLADFGIVSPDLVEYEQGVSQSFPVAVKLPEGQNPIVNFESLPEGAVYEAGAVKWTPPCNWGVKQGKFHRGYEVVRVKIIAQSKEDTSIHLERVVALLIHKTKRSDSPCRK